MNRNVDLEELAIGIGKSLERMTNTLSIMLEVLNEINGKLELREDGVTHKAGRTEILMPPEALGFDEETPPEWLEKMRVIPRVLQKLNLSIQPGCWIYSGVMTQGSMYIYHPHTGRKVTIRKFLYEYLIGPLPDGYKTTKPSCNELCVNPLHLKIPRMVQQGVAREDDTEFDRYMIGMEKQRQNVAFQNGQKYRQFPAAHWDIVYRTEQGLIVGPTRFEQYLKMHHMYHYLDPVVNTPSRNPDIPTDLEWMNREMGPRTKEAQPAARVKSLAESLGIEE